MIGESFMLPRNRALDRRWADEAGETISPAEKAVAAVASVAIAIGTAFVVAMPFALLHLR